VKVALLSPPLVVTTITSPVVAPLGTANTMLVSLQLMAVRGGAAEVHDAGPLAGPEVGTGNCDSWFMHVN
jgi:hypothetical protein